VERRYDEEAVAMTRLVFSARVWSLAILSAALGSATFAASADGDGSEKPTPDRPAMAQKQLVSGTDCETATTARSKPRFLSTAEYRDDVLITVRYCDATGHNRLNPTKPEIVVVGADSGASGENKIFYRTVPKNDAKKVHDTCVLAGKAALTYLPAATTATPQADGADVQTGSGKTDCDAFLRATGADNPLVVLAPAAISGSTISVHILNMIGLRKPVTDVQAAVDELRHQLAGSGALSADDLRKYPQIVLNP
jgi:hypothetical protein